MTWHENASCRGTSHPDMWFSDDHATTEAAKRICRDCDVRRECLDFALETRQMFGTWGGLDITGREKEKKARRRAELERKQRVA